MTFFSIFRTVLLAGALLPSLSAATPDVDGALARMPSEHPRLILTAPLEKRLRERLATGKPALVVSIHQRIIARATGMLDLPPSQRVMVGRRLLAVSRQVLDRVLHLSYAWRMTGEARYRDRAVREIDAACAFTDWNPGHFLDVAELTAAVAVGYDWLYAGLDEVTRSRIAAGLMRLGVEPAMQGKPFWVTADNNWSQVCHGGVVVAALALDPPPGTREGKGDWRAKAIARAVANLPIALKAYAPDGAYVEGPTYWNYGTMYSLLMLGCMESALGTDFGLAESPGFMASATYYQHVASSDLRFFNYADAASSRVIVGPEPFWFAKRSNDYSLLWSTALAAQRDLDKDGATNAEKRPGARLLPMAMAWMVDVPDTIPAPTRTTWTGRGLNPVGLHRSSWATGATFVGIKGGMAALNHGHSDVGGFVLDADGVRWAHDLGMQPYESLESKGVKLWDRSAKGERWSVFRIGPFSHNIITVDGAQPVVDGAAVLTVAKDNRTVFDLSATYRGQLASAARGLALLPDGSVLIQDELRATATSAPVVRWAMMTSGTTANRAPGRIELSEAGQRLRIDVVEPAGAEFREWPADPPPAPTDMANPGKRLIGLSIPIAAGASQAIRIRFTPGSLRTPAAIDVPPTLSKW